MFRGKLTCVTCGKGSTYKIERKATKCKCCDTERVPERVHSDDEHRVVKKQCTSCYKREMIAQMYDEVGGFLGNNEYTGKEETLTALAKAIVAHGWARHYGASEYQVYKALKDNQDEEEDILMWPDGDTKTLEK